MNKVAVVGFGCAGYHCVKALRNAGYPGTIDVFSESADPPANPMLTTYYTAGKIPYEALFPFGTTDEITKEFDIAFHRNTRVEKLFAGEKTLMLQSGEKRRYDRILISTGAVPVIPKIEGLPSKNVYYMRTAKDASLLKARLSSDNIERAVIIGASMVGIKVAELLKNIGVECTLADAASTIFPLSATAQIALEIERRIEEQSINLLFGKPVTSFLDTGKGIKVCFGSQSVDADIAVLCIGTRPSVGFVNKNEIEIRRGIITDENMMTSADGIYAAGDCCAGKNIQTGEKQVIGLWANAAYQGRAAGMAMAGKESGYDGTILHNITHFMGMDFIGFGDIRSKGESVYFEKPDHSFMIHMIMDGKRPECVNILDNYAISGIIKHYMIKRFLGYDEPVSPIQRGLLLKYGLPDEILYRMEGRA